MEKLKNDTNDIITNDLNDNQQLDIDARLTKILVESSPKLNRRKNQICSINQRQKFETLFFCFNFILMFFNMRIFHFYFLIENNSSH